MLVHDDEVKKGKNKEEREAILGDKVADEIEALHAEEMRLEKLKMIEKLVDDAQSCLKYLKENVSRQVDVQRIEANLSGDLD